MCCSQTLESKEKDQIIHALRAEIGSKTLSYEELLVMQEERWGFQKREELRNNVFRAKNATAALTEQHSQELAQLHIQKDDLIVLSKRLQMKLQRYKEKWYVNCKLGTWFVW